MKVQELRKLLGNAEREHLEKAFVECYKQLRKGQKEEIDSILTMMLEGKAIEQKSVEAPVNFEELEQQIIVFIDNAYAQNYFAPNRTIPKSQRPKWRFMVKNFMKELSKVPSDSNHYERAVKLLTDLYCLICEACNTYLFSTEDPFRSIGWEQPDFFKLLVTKTFANGYSRKNISQLLRYATTGGLSRESLHIQQEMILLSALRTSDVKYVAIEEAKKLVEEGVGKLASLKKYSSSQYYMNEAVNELCGMIFLITIALAEPESGMEYYFAHSREGDNEITLYCALQLADWVGGDDLWIKVYEYGLSKKIKPRNSLKEEYAIRLGSLKAQD